MKYGEEKILQSGQNGYSVSTIRRVYLNGELVKTEKLPSSYYSARTQEVARNENAVPEPEATEDTNIPVDVIVPETVITPEETVPEVQQPTEEVVPRPMDPNVTTELIPQA